jgi:hypothetical protein
VTLRIPTRALTNELVRLKFVPDDCVGVTLHIGVDGALVLHYDVFATTDKLRALAEAFVACADHLETPSAKESSMFGHHHHDGDGDPKSAANEKVTVIRLDNGEPFIEDAQLESNSDGSVSFRLPGGGYAGQDPEHYGERADGDATQQYQRATVAGSMVTFLPHPDFPAYVYLLGAGKVYPA